MIKFTITLLHSVLKRLLCITIVLKNKNQFYTFFLISLSKLEKKIIKVKKNSNF